MGQKVALVTGGAQGIGRAIAQALASRGYALAVADADAAAGAESEFTFLRCDVSKEPAVRRCVAAVLRRFGRLDALVNNAGLAGPHDPPVERLPLASWNRRLGVNLTGVFLMSKHCIPHLRKAGGAIELRKFEGQPHAFVGRDPEAPPAREAVAAITAFVRRQAS